MKIGMVSDSPGHLSFEDMPDTAARLGVQGVEINAASWTSAPHMRLADLLASSTERRGFLAAIKRRGLGLIALNANGNQLHPTDGKRQSNALYDTIRLAGALGVETVVPMSGLPEGGKGDSTPNWVVASWPPETQAILKYQWEDRLPPYWAKLALHAKGAFISKPVCALTRRLENGSPTDVPGRAWSYITPGYGNGESWWRDFCYRLRMAGYDGWLAIAHEDVLPSREEGVLKSVRLPQDVAPSEASDYKPQAI